MVDRLSMVPLATTRSGFEAKVLAARLGAEGIVWQIRGGSDGVYPVGAVEVLVRRDDLEQARELLLVDEVEAAFSDVGDETGDSRVEWWLGAGLVLCVGVVLIMRLLAMN
jgi:hypothetical protein